MGSALIHVVALGFLWATTLIQPETPEFVTYEFDLVSPPATVEEVTEEPPAPEEELVVETPDPQPPEPEEEEVPPVVEEEPEPEPQETEPEKEPEPDPDPTPPPATEEPEEPEESGEDINVRMEGLRQDFPGYYENIIRQIQRCFRPPRGSDRGAVVQFTIRRDGTVSDMDIVEPSGSIEFDLQALAAVECIGEGRLGPLPEDFRFDQLPIQFEFRPPGRDGSPDHATPEHPTETAKTT